MTRLGAGHSVPWYHEPGRLLGPDVPQLGGFTVFGAPVRWLWLVPISERERLLSAERGSASLVTQLAAQRRSWVAG